MSLLTKLFFAGLFVSMLVFTYSVLQIPKNLQEMEFNSLYGFTSLGFTLFFLFGIVIRNKFLLRK